MTINSETMKALCAFCDAVTAHLTLTDTFEKTMRATPREISESVQTVRKAKERLFVALAKED